MEIKVKKVEFLDVYDIQVVGDRYVREDNAVIYFSFTKNQIEMTGTATIPKQEYYSRSKDIEVKILELLQKKQTPHDSNL